MRVIIQQTVNLFSIETGSSLLALSMAGKEQFPGSSYNISTGSEVCGILHTIPWNFHQKISEFRISGESKKPFSDPYYRGLHNNCRGLDEWTDIWPVMPGSVLKLQLLQNVSLLIETLYGLEKE